ncbi:Uncharacterised protein [Mycobacterium tuberculosis]|nr:Uncharacterised protein [Mycobacterium tuberculosis]
MRADHDGGGGVILGGEDVARGPADFGAQRGEGFDQHRGLHRHVQRTRDPGPLQGLHLGILAPQRHQAGHLVLGDPEFFAAEIR